MFDEPGYNYQPAPKSLEEKKQPTQEIPPQKPPLSPVGIGQRPLWLRLSTYLLGFVVVTRLCSVTGDDALSVIVQFGSAGVLMMIIFGLITMRRWAAWLFIIYCIWSILSSVVVGIYRISILDETVESLADRDGILLSLLFGMGFTFILYSALGVWFGMHLNQFIPLPLSLRYGNIPYAVMIGLLVLFTATQIAVSHDYIQLQQESLQESRGMTQDMQRFFFGN